MIVNKVTNGFVVQRYDTDKQKFIGQEFIAGDSTWENEFGDSLESLDIEEPSPKKDLSMEMIQPK